MADGTAGPAARHLDTLFRVGAIGAATDAQLLERFLDRRDHAAAEAAFTALVERHGPMVLRACRGILGDPHAAEDAFQATFLVLVRTAGSIRSRDSVASWLFGVAGRVARRARVDAARRRVHERRWAEMAVRTVGDRGPDDLGPLLHEEVGRLPEIYRAAVVLCDLEGRSYEQAAQQLRWPLGTLKTRLSRGRARLRQQLVRRGLEPPAGLAGSVLAPAVTSAAVPPALLRAAVRSALVFRVSGAAVATGVVSARVAALTEGVLSTMLRMKLYRIAAHALALGASLILAAGLTAAPPRRPGRPPR